jgi:hypothetical protein
MVLSAGSWTVDKCGSEESHLLSPWEEIVLCGRYGGREECVHSGMFGRRLVWLADEFHVRSQGEMILTLTTVDNVAVHSHLEKVAETTQRGSVLDTLNLCTS